MSFLSYIARLRRLPLTERRQIAVSWTMILIIVIGIAWLGISLVGFKPLFGSHNSVPVTDLTPTKQGITPPY